MQNFCRDLSEILGEFLAAEILRSRRDPRRDLGGQKLTENLTEILVRSRRDLCKNFARVAIEKQEITPLNFFGVAQVAERF